MNEEEHTRAKANARASGFLYYSLTDSEGPFVCVSLNS